MNEIQDSILDQRLRNALGSPTKPDFDGWRERHGETIAFLNPVVTELHRRRRRFLFRLASGAIAAVLLVSALVWVLGPQQPSFAETVKVLTEAKSITWTMTSYNRCQSKDGKHTWLKSNSSKFAYLQPGLVRWTEYDDQGNESSVTTMDTRSGKFLVLNLKEKKTDPRLRLAFGGPMPAGGPFGYIADVLKTKPVELVGQRKVDGRVVNVFRYRRENMPVKQNTVDIWIDAETKQYAGSCDPSADFFDPETTPEINNPPQKQFGLMTILGSTIHEINYNAKLDPELFSLTPPAGFQVVEPPKLLPVSEEKMVEWLGLMARVNNDTFVDKPLVAFYNERVKDAFTRVDTAKMKAKKIAPLPDQLKESGGNPSPDEKKLVKVFNEYQASRHHPASMRAPLEDFVKEETVPDSFRYLGKGVKLGSADRIVCWYKLKSTGKHRAVYGNLTVKDVKPEDLPLSVEK